METYITLKKHNTWKQECNLSAHQSWWRSIHIKHSSCSFTQEKSHPSSSTTQVQQIRSNSSSYLVIHFPLPPPFPHREYATLHLVFLTLTCTFHFYCSHSISKQNESCDSDPRNSNENEWETQSPNRAYVQLHDLIQILQKEKKETIAASYTLFSICCWICFPSYVKVADAFKWILYWQSGKSTICLWCLQSALKKMFL